MTAKKIAVLGGGAFGTALACDAARAGNQVNLWCRDETAANSINRDHKNPAYLGDALLPEELTATTDISDALSGASSVIIATPAQTFLKVTKLIARDLMPDAILVSAAKGIDQETGFLPTETLKILLPDHKRAALSGPSFAADIVAGLPTAVTIASENLDDASVLCETLSSGTFRCYASDDPKGVELGGALKNVLALAVGLARGLGLGASAEAALIARGFAEINRVATTKGAKAETLTGLSGLGDLILTCSSPQSRNFSYGIALGKREKLEGLKLAEGVFTATIAERIAVTEGVNCPIISAVTSVLDDKLDPMEAVSQLLNRPLKAETEK